MSFIVAEKVFGIPEPVCSRGCCCSPYKCFTVFWQRNHKAGIERHCPWTACRSRNRQANQRSMSQGWREARKSIVLSPLLLLLFVQFSLDSRPTSLDLRPTQLPIARRSSSALEKEDTSLMLRPVLLCCHVRARWTRLTGFTEPCPGGHPEESPPLAM